MTSRPCGGYTTYVGKRKNKRKGCAEEVTRTLQQRISESHLSQNEIARRSGIAYGMISRFVHGERGMTLTTAAKVAKVLDLELKLLRKRGKKKG